MRQEKQDDRKKQIRQAAYRVLTEKGYRGTSMLAIAKQAKASNETLYRWYGNKQNLFRSLIEENAEEVRQHLKKAIREDRPIHEGMNEVGQRLLDLVVSDKAIALNRAAAADAQDTATLGPTLAEAGRNTVAPLIDQLFQKAGERGELIFEEGDRVTETYIRLLIGDLQVRRVTGALPPLTKPEIAAQAEQANRLFFRLFAPTR